MFFKGERTASDKSIDVVSGFMKVKLYACYSNANCLQLEESHCIADHNFCLVVPLLLGRSNDRMSGSIECKSLFSFPSVSGRLTAASHPCLFFHAPHTTSLYLCQGA